MPRLNRNHGMAAGFTLVELLVVLALLGLLLALIPQLAAGLARLRLHMAAAGMAEVIRQLRDEATRTGRQTTFLLDTPHQRYALNNSSEWRPLPASVQAITLWRDSPVPSMMDDVVRFYPDGSASGGRLTLRSGLQTAEINIDWLTGRVWGGD